MIRQIGRLTALTLAVTLPLAACEQMLTDPDALDPSKGAAETTVLLSGEGTGASPSLSPAFSQALLAVAAQAAGPVSLGQIKSIDVKVIKVQVLRADTAAKADSILTLNVTGGGKINLLALPTKDGLQLAKGTLPAGTYSNLVLVLDSATITFKQDVTAGGGPKATTYKKDTAHPLDIGGGQRTVLRVPTGSFTVSKDAGATVNVAFSGSESVKKVIVTPQGIKMPPVLSAKGTGRGK